MVFEVILLYITKQEEATPTPASATASKAAESIVPSGWKTISKEEEFQTYTQNSSFFFI